MGKIFKLFGVFFLLVGTTIVFNTFQGLTGFAIYENVSLDKGFIIGAWFVFTGILLAVYRKQEKK